MKRGLAAGEKKHDLATLVSRPLTWPVWRGESMRTLALLLLSALLALTVGGCIYVNEAPDPADPSERYEPFRESYEISPFDVIGVFGSSTDRQP
jgi:hypothetical protein